MLRRLSNPRAPLTLLLLLVAVSLGLRLAFLSTPHSPVFDEHYYVNAARTMLSLPVEGDIYAGAPPGLDPNPAHPGLAKAIIALSIKMFGDHHFAWRLPSVLFGTGALAALYWLARSAGMSSWTALGAAGLASVDTLLFLNSRIGTLDIFAVTFMILAAGFYLNKRLIPAGLMLGLGASAKLVALALLLVIAFMELFKVALEIKQRSFEIGPKVKQAAGVVLLASLALGTLLSFSYVYDRTFTNITNPLKHTVGMLTAVTSGNSDPSLEALRKEQSGGQDTRVVLNNKRVGRAANSTPLEWLLNRSAINYYNLDAPGGDVTSWTLFGMKSSDLMNFSALINPAIIFPAIPALGFCGFSAWRKRDPGIFLPVAWFLGTFGPFLAADLAGIPRTGYIYYMLIVLPGIYLAVAYLFSGKRAAIWASALALTAITCFWIYYPYRTWAGVKPGP